MKAYHYSASVERCYILYQRAVFNIIMNYVEDIHLAEDLTQDLFFRMLLYNSLPDPDNTSCSSYMKKAARNIAFDHMRYARRVGRDSILSTGNIEQYEDDIAGIEETIVDGEVLHTMMDTIRELDAGGQTLLKSYYCDNKSYSDIAQEQNMSTYLVKKKVNSIRSDIRKKLDDEFRE